MVKDCEAEVEGRRDGHFADVMLDIQFIEQLNGAFLFWTELAEQQPISQLPILGH